jgi:hypothetical protein
MMFSGVMDSKDAQVYEGDLVRTGNNLRWEVCYGDFTIWGSKSGEDRDFLSWHLHSVENIKVREMIMDEQMTPMRRRMRLEILGNIYENPELMKN